MGIVDRIIALIDAAGLTQENFAYELSQKSMIKITKQTITDWKAGKSNSYYRVIVDIANLFGTSTDYILTGKTTLFLLSENEQEFLSILKNLSSERDQLKLIGYSDCYARQLPSYLEEGNNSKEDTSSGKAI